MTPRPLRIGVLANTYQDRVGVLAGGHIYLIEVIRAWRDVDVTIFGPESARTEFCRFLPDVRYVSMPSFGSLPWQLDQLLRGPAGALDTGELRKMDALLATSTLPGDIVPAIAALPERTVACLFHLIAKPSERLGVWVSNAANWTVQSICLNLVRTFVRSIVFISPYVMNQCAYMADGKRFFLSTCGVTPMPPPRPDAPERAGAIYLGRIHPAKRIVDAVEAWAKLPPELSSLKLKIVGSGEPQYEELLRATAARLGIADRVVFYGTVTEQRKWELLQESQFFVFPSGEEGWGIAIGEAMTAGLPCVTYDLPVYRELFTSGRVEVPLGDVNALAAACAELSQDPARLERLTREARALSTEFTWDKAAQTVFEAISSVLPADAVGRPALRAAGKATPGTEAESLGRPPASSRIGRI